MKPMLRTMALLLAGLIGLVGELRAQDAPTMGAFGFSDGVHPTIEAVFPGAEPRVVEGFWRDELKAISMKVGGRKELVGQAARIPTASPDTLRILIKVERPKGATDVTAHIAFLTTAGYVGPDSDKRLREGCLAWVQQRTVTLRRRVAQQVFEAGRRDLAVQQRKLADLQRDKQRAEDGILRANQRSERAAKDKAAAEQELARMDSTGTTAVPDSAAQAAQVKQRAKQQAKLRDRIRRSETIIADAKKKTEDLQWAIKTNLEAQADQQKAVDRQQDLVNRLQEKLQAIQ